MEVNEKREFQTAFKKIRNLMVVSPPNLQLSDVRLGRFKGGKKSEEGM